MISGKWSEDRAVIDIHVRSVSRVGEQKVMSGEVLFWFLLVGILVGSVGLFKGIR